jgi:hypothetical protein
VTAELEQYCRNQSLKPLTVAVKTAAKLLGVGITSTWGLISTRRVEVIRIGRRTLVTMASLEALVATLASSCDLEPEELIESRNGVLDMPSIRMTLGEVRGRISAAGLVIKSEERLPNNLGTQIVTVFGQVADVYDTGAVVVHGRNAENLRTIFSAKSNKGRGAVDDWAPPSTADRKPAQPPGAPDNNQTRRKN